MRAKATTKKTVAKRKSPAKYRTRVKLVETKGQTVLTKLKNMFEDTAAKVKTILPLGKDTPAEQKSQRVRRSRAG